MFESSADLGFAFSAFRHCWTWCHFILGGTRFNGPAIVCATQLGKEQSKESTANKKRKREQRPQRHSKGGKRGGEWGFGGDADSRPHLGYGGQRLARALGVLTLRFKLGPHYGSVRAMGTARPVHCHEDGYAWISAAAACTASSNSVPRGASTC